MIYTDVCLRFSPRFSQVKAEKILKAALEKEETEATAALVKGTNNADNPVRNNASVDGSDNISPKQLKLKPKPKPIRQPEWVDDYKVPDPVIGRGRGKPREEPLAKPVKASHSKGPCALDSTVSDTPTASSQPQPAPQAKPQNILPKATENMTTSQKITVEIISKARNKVMSPEEAGKPLSNLEMSLMNRCVSTTLTCICLHNAALGHGFSMILSFLFAVVISVGPLSTFFLFFFAQSVGVACGKDSCWRTRGAFPTRACHAQ